MRKEENNNIEEHLEDVKRYDSDLFEEQDEIEKYLNTTIIDDHPMQHKRNEKSKLKKSILFFIAFFMIISAIGTLTNVLNLPVVEFLQKSQQLSKDPVIQTYKEAIVTVKAAERKGTGFNISKDGYIVTNYHIVREEQESLVSFQDGSVYVAHVIKTYPKKDLALLALDSNKTFPFFKIETQKNWNKDDLVYFVGNPLSFNFIANQGTIIGETDVNSLDIPALLIQAPVYNGNSGSPIINADGYVIAMIYAKGNATIGNESQEVGFAIPIYAVRDLIEDNTFSN
ncbi:S1C family serine protease [Bacillus sp. Marseille-P3661]|uniref:S1C family serine protease n=1 Tax=Bacillus sp. Marseille-P3661 TaxID=1936234 RepID=UPI0015E18E6F|nr:serine protease [Bacillus sp. Marseille-P3661]